MTDWGFGVPKTAAATRLPQLVESTSLLKSVFSVPKRIDFCMVDIRCYMAARFAGLASKARKSKMAKQKAPNFLRVSVEGNTLAAPAVIKTPSAAVLIARCHEHSAADGCHGPCFD
jgi:hypothetical protein